MKQRTPRPRSTSLVADRAGRLRIAIVGAGAVGSFLGACLGQRNLAWLVDRRADASGAANPSDLELIGPRGGRRVTPVTRVPSVESLPDDLDLVVIAVKQADLPAVALSLAARPGVPILTVQNGVGAEGIVQELRPSGGLIAASLTAAVGLDGGRVRWLRRGGLGLAAAAGDVAVLIRRLASDVESVGLPVAVLEDAARMKWSKLFVNLVANATSAILDLDPATIYRDRRLFEVERRQLLETLAVMHRQGLALVALPGANAPLLGLGVRVTPALGRPILARVVRGARGGKMPSLRVHIASGRAGPTEVRWLNGAVVDAGDRLLVPVPVNRTLARLVDEVAVSAERRAWFRGRPARLLDEIRSTTG